MPKSQRSLLRNLIEGLKHWGAGQKGALVGAILGLFLVVFGLWKTLFICLLSAVGFFIGVRYFSRKEDLRQILDRLFPPGRFR